jgi:hypothetical protein
MFLGYLKNIKIFIQIYYPQNDKNLLKKNLNLKSFKKIPWNDCVTTYTCKQLYLRKNQKTHI